MLLSISLKLVFGLVSLMLVTRVLGKKALADVTPDGVINLKALSKNHIEMEQLRTMLRQQQCFSLENAKHIILESAGQVSVLKNSQEDSYISLMLVDHGIIQDRVLETHGLTRKWLLDNLNKEGYTLLHEIIYVEWSAEKAFYILTNHDVMNKDYRIDG
ncbi:YetF domain-containing protein [Aerococcus urinaeequi]|uniref:YetF domain-containing protein n=1 Tax=Aerococcus urinaeequi TaxID=51665 RepID=UPI003AAF7EC1